MRSSFATNAAAAAPGMTQSQVMDTLCAMVVLDSGGSKKLQQQKKSSREKTLMKVSSRGNTSKKSRKNRNASSTETKMESSNRGSAYLDAQTQKNADLMLELKSLRYRLASKHDVPEYVIAPNRTLEDMAEQQPRNRDQFLELHGMGPQRFKMYGHPFMELLENWRNR